MKKTLIALAALAATAAFAQDAVSIKGTLDPSYQNVVTTNNAGNAFTQNKIANNAQGTSQVTFYGTENLGGGLKALFLYEMDFDATVIDATTTTATSGHVAGSRGGEVYAGLSGGFGSIKLGGANTPSLTTQGSRQFFGTKIGSGFGGVQGTGHVRSNGSMVYATPSFSGFSAAVGYIPQTDTSLTATTKATSDVGVFYANGPLNAGVSVWNQEGTTGQTNLFVSYAIGAATVTVGAHSEDIAGKKSTGQNIALKYALNGNMDLLANVGRLDDQEATDNDKNISAIGLQYRLSKRTSIYGRYVLENNSYATVVSTDVAKVQTTLVGLQHNF